MCWIFAVSGATTTKIEFQFNNPCTALSSLLFKKATAGVVFILQLIVWDYSTPAIMLLSALSSPIIYKDEFCMMCPFKAEASKCGWFFFQRHKHKCLCFHMEKKKPCHLILSPNCCILPLPFWTRSVRVSHYSVLHLRQEKLV